MDVLVGPTFDHAFVPRRSAQDPVVREIGSALNKLPPPDEQSESSSSIGAPGDSDDDDEVSSRCDGKISRKFGSLGSLEDALPIKRGLSNHFTGKSKSFANLSQVMFSMNDVKEVEKQENPFNKRRRILIRSRLARKSFYGGGSFNPKSMPLLPVVDENDDDDSDGEEQLQGYGNEDCESELSSTSSSDGKEEQHRKLGGFKSHSCFSLCDLQEEDGD